MKCTKCNCENKQEAKYCYNCGEELKRNNNGLKLIVRIIVIMVFMSLGFFIGNKNAEMFSADYRTEKETVRKETEKRETEKKETEAPKMDPIEEYVIRMYNVCLGRKPDEIGLADWCSKLKSQKATAKDIVQGLIFSNEFKDKKLSNEAYVEVLYKSLFGRNADAQGKQNWINAMKTGSTREQILNEFLKTDEFFAFCNKYGVKAK